MRVAELPFVSAVTAVIVMITHPAPVYTATIVAFELVFSTRGWRGALVQGGVLVGPVHAVWVAITQPLAGDALSSIPLLVLCAREFRFLVAFSIIALMPFVLIRVVQAVVVSIADVDAGNAVAIVAREQISKACSAF